MTLGLEDIELHNVYDQGVKGGGGGGGGGNYVNRHFLSQEQYELTDEFSKNLQQQQQVYIPNNSNNNGNNGSSDFILARALQALEFEMQYDLNHGNGFQDEEEEDFYNKEVRRWGGASV